MTDDLCAQVAALLPPESEVIGATARFGSPVIASHASFAIAAHAVLDAYARHVVEGTASVDAVIVGCFGDPGLAALRELADVPVIGLAEASFAAARRPFAVVTSGLAWRSILREQVDVLGHRGLCHGIFALAGTGLDARNDPAGVAMLLDDLVAEALQAGAMEIILAGAALAGFATRLRPGPDYIDCVTAAVGALATACVSEPNAAQQPAGGVSVPLAAMMAGRAGLR